MGKLKNKLSKYFAPIMVVCAIMVGGSIDATLAYLTSQGALEENHIVMGNVDVKIIEDFTPPSKVKQGQQVYQKKVNFQNDGTVDSYVRVAMEFSDEAILDNETAVSSNGGLTWYAMDDFKSHLPSGWEYKSTGKLSGYFYYTKPVAVGDSTTDLITNVRTQFITASSDSMDYRYTQQVNDTPKDYDIYVYAEAIQSQRLNGSDTPYTSYEDAWNTFLSKK